jgi:hypothetical protein
MICHHHEVCFEMPDTWLTEAGISDLNQKMTYAANKNASKTIFEVQVSDVEPLVERANGIGVFCDNKQDSAKQRVVRILTWMRSGVPIEPVKVVTSKQNLFRYQLTHGCHRFHCAVALGIAAIPAVQGFDIRSIDD